MIPFLAGAGKASILIALLCSIGAMYFYYRAAGNSDSAARSGFYGHWLWGLKGFFLLGASGILVYFLITHQFQYFYVYNYTSSDLGVHFLIAAFWGGQEGSFMLWMLITSLIGLGMIRWIDNDYRAPVMFVMTLTQFFLITMIAGIDVFGVKIGASPFRTLVEEMADAPFLQANPDFVPADGKGLNDLLRSSWMLIHPPILFFGFSMMTIPFAFAIAALWKRRYYQWVKPALPWTLGANLCLLTAIFLGGYWAYETLSFGGYWAWDPVENASFVPWLVGVAGIHMMLIQRKSGAAHKSALLFALLAYATVVYETFLTRSGILGDASVHSFVDLGLYNQLLLFMLVIVGLGLGFYAVRYRDMPSNGKDNPLFSKESMIFLGAMSLFLIGLVILVGTSAPILGRLFVANPTPPEIRRPKMGAEVVCLWRILHHQKSVFITIGRFHSPS